jgi:hypothetical protein
VIDWWGVLSNLLWVLGLALLLATWSVAYYDARTQGVPTLRLLEVGGYSLSVTVGLILFCLGMVATEERLWAQVLWGVLALAFLLERTLGDRFHSEQGGDPPAL